MQIHMIPTYLNTYTNKYRNHFFNILEWVQTWWIKLWFFFMHKIRKDQRFDHETSQQNLILIQIHMILTCLNK